jgi:hypothetical protein
MRRSEVVTPKLAFPFELSATGVRAKVVEQNSDEEVSACLEVLLRTVVGTREEVPDYGIPDQAFRENGASRAQILAAIHLWEQRARVDMTEGQIEDLIQRVQIHYVGRSRA